MGAEEPAAVTIASTQQAAVFADNVQYQFRTENSSGQVSMTFDSFGRRGEFYRGWEGVRSNHGLENHLKSRGRTSGSFNLL